ncbi:DNA-3-methyladenine glycosylase I [Oceanospirillum multiglobuliferum]|uniref:3-methyladenine DNA glycosylase n=1 Tax=Oceanospirillum multiglobuliferum TaxID=64969 RepID=A0A1T4LBS8_9GAMM|nr:DNA-3-methyladenine glycosylase I [Oceanospirillum multiglobuliferum]OPX56715.1 3-methyladenine DNA glycosylase [Oceanospirillum multiglobuliferum]SJZ52282.1 DNA-3-methyladenine glycosylase I [Oceanospirillum multiglobuliferum]
METFEQIYQRAAARKGGEQALESLMPVTLSRAELAQLDDSRYLAQFTKSIFQSGFVWRVVEQKWPDFEAQFFNFEPETLLLLSDEQWEKKAQDPKIIRNLSKVMTIKHNAQMIYDLQYEQGSFAQFVAQWPNEDVVGLWQFLKKRGKRLGGNTGPYALRYLGFDTFLLTNDVWAYLKAHNIVTATSATSVRALTEAQAAFNQWQQQSGRTFSVISRTIAMSMGDNVV